MVVYSNALDFDRNELRLECFDSDHPADLVNLVHLNSDFRTVEWSKQWSIPAMDLAASQRTKAAQLQV